MPHWSLADAFVTLLIRYIWNHPDSLANHTFQVVEHGKCGLSIQIDRRLTPVDSQKNELKALSILGQSPLFDQQFFAFVALMLITQISR